MSKYNNYYNIIIDYMNTINNLYTIITDPKFYVVAGIVVLFIIIKTPTMKSIQDNMRHKFLTNKCFYLDGWSLSHFILYVYFGFMFPEYFIEFLLIGAGVEVFESTACKVPKIFSKQCADSQSLVCKSINSVRDCQYWYGKLDDLFVNMAGYVTGCALRKYL